MFNKKGLNLVMDTLYCVGDSHVSFFSGQEKMVEIYPYYKNFFQYIRSKYLFLKRERIDCVHDEFLNIKTFSPS